MRELLVTNDPVLISFVTSLLTGEGIEAVVFDGHISVIEGSIGAFPRRLLVADGSWPQARRVMVDAGLAEWVAGHDQG